MTPRLVMHDMDTALARRLGVLIGCAVTLSENHPGDQITLYGFYGAISEIGPIVRAEAPGWRLRFIDGRSII